MAAPFIGAAGMATLVTGGPTLPLSVLATACAVPHLLAVYRSRLSYAVSGAALGLAGLVATLVASASQTLDLTKLRALYFNPSALDGLGAAFARGVLNTVTLAGTAEIVGIAVGLTVALAAISRRFIVRAPAVGFVDLFRGTPLLVQLSFIYFAFPFIGIRLNAFQAGLVGLSLNSSAYVAEIFRAGIESIPKGQFEAASSLGMPRRTAMLHIVVPQAFRRVVPPLTNEFIALLKDSSLVAVLGTSIAGRELFKVARDAYASSGNATPFVAASVLYLCMTIPLVRLTKRLEARTG